VAKQKIAVIEDEPDIREMIEHHLNREGFSVVTAADGEAGLDLVQRRGIDLVLLDLLLPGRNGIEVCRRIKADAATRRIPVIIVSAKGEESDIVLGLGVGADDYVTKPFSPRELVARVHAVLRRGTLQDEGEVGKRIEREGLVVDPSRHEVRVDGLPVEFTATEFRLLRLLASHPGRVFTREQLLDRVIGDRAVVIQRNIDVHVRAIRKKLGSQRDLVGTIRGVGYRFRDQEEPA
jgi:DNA-binding response OmpR family regulator